jgi:hypothetical protein
MEACSFCQAPTELYDGGVPVCVKCSEARDQKRKPPNSETQTLRVLYHDLEAATARAKAATAAFEAVTREIPSGIPRPDGTQRIYNASREVSVARVELMRAHNRLNDYLGRGILPDDLKQRSGS